MLGFAFMRSRKSHYSPWRERLRSFRPSGVTVHVIKLSAQHYEVVLYRYGRVHRAMVEGTAQDALTTSRQLATEFLLPRRDR